MLCCSKQNTQMKPNPSFELKIVSSILYMIDLLKNAVKISDTVSGEIMFRLNEIEFDDLDFKFFNSLVIHSTN